MHYDNYRLSCLRNRIFDTYGEPNSPDELGDLVVKILNSRLEPDNKSRIVGLTWDLRHWEINNTFNHPIDGVNFLPVSYSGFIGTATIRYNNFLSDCRKRIKHNLLCDTLIYNHSGFTLNCDIMLSKAGYHTESYFGNIYFFTDDWPKIKKYTDKIKLLKDIKNDDSPINLKYRWTEEYTSLRDQAILDEYFNKELNHVS